MCTVSWTIDENGYELFFNRDESRARVPGLPPGRHTASEGTPYIAPNDPQGGGSWIFVNAHGLTACVLNYYSAEISVSPVKTSRGRLLLSLADALSSNDIERRLKALTSAQVYRPCLILSLSLTEKVHLWRWDGVRLESRLPMSRDMITTSSFETERILAARYSAYEQLPTRDGDALRAFHRADGIDADASTIRMSRPDARSVSFTHITVDSRLAFVDYAARTKDGPFAQTLDGLTLPLLKATE